VRWVRWIDHLPLWVALGAAASTGYYEPGELGVMALPLAAAALVEGFRWDISRFQRWLEVGALLIFLADLSRGQGIFAVAVHTLFLLAGLRLALPRELTHRRQAVLMGFLLFITTTVSTTDVVFLAWALLWFAAAAAALLQQAWEGSASLRRGSPTRPPFARIPLWLGAAVFLGTGFFLILPRLSTGFRPAFLGATGALPQAGLGDHLDLAGGGPILPNPEVALRILPPPGTDPATLRGLELLRGLALEALDGQRWEPTTTTPPPEFRPPRLREERRAEFLFSPSGRGILTLPYGLMRLASPDPPLRRGPGGSIRWIVPRAKPIPLEVSWNPAAPEPQEPRLSGRRLELLLALAPEHEVARRWSLRFAPGILPTPDLVRRLEQALRGFRYTLDNPSGKAANPLEDFLERTQAGHCEYFASALALMLRARGVPARVVNGYRLGPWIPEGGYFRISQDQAHSWVEYWHEGTWRQADPTPASGTGSERGMEGLGLLARWADTLRYRWDRHVVRFSDQDQQAGLSWLQARIQGWEWRWQAPPAGLSWMLGLVAAAWLAWRTRRLWQPLPPGPGQIRALRPLLSATQRSAPPGTGDTARIWLLRLGTLRPERAAALARLADAVDAAAYGSQTTSASALAKAEAEAWRGWKPTSR
jgi:hypothetical protein